MSLTKLGKEMEQYLQNPYVLAMLDVISEAEGTAKEGYHARFGSGRYKSLAKHPNESQQFTTKSGKKERTTAAGRYQFIGSTWNEEAKKLGLTDFSPRSQDLAAISRLKFRGALDAVAKGDFATALPKLGIEWAALPSSPYDQNKRTDRAVAAMVDKYVAARTGGEAPTAKVEERVAQAETRVAQAEEQTLSLDDRKAEISRLIQESIDRGAAEQVATDVEAADLAALAATDAEQSTTPDWAAQLPATETLLDAPMPEQFGEAWEDSLIRQAATLDADAVRAQAQADFLGTDYIAPKPLPRPLERAINRVVSLI